ncbi:MAG: glycosyltransferase, partial [Chloroflexi bacterium]|nr:glycosyltransferase [Chloroflexota bacterium]
FPGWHIECSAMSTKYLGEQLDIHTGGVDNIFPHHEGEIAQSEGAFGKQYVQLWVHGQHLLADGVKMAKSVANDYTLEDLEERGFDPLAFRFLCLTARYRSRLNFTFSALRAADKALQRLRHRVWEWSQVTSPNARGAETERWRSAFWDRVNDDLDMPGALAMAWAMARSNMSPRSKLGLLLEFDGVLGLQLERVPEVWKVPPEIEHAGRRRAALRARRDYATADSVRQQVTEAGFVLEDALASTRARPGTGLEMRQQRWSEVSSSREVLSLVDVPDQAEFSVGIVACNYLSDVQRCIRSVLRVGERHDLEVVLVDNGSSDGTSSWLDEQAREEPRLRVIHTDHVLGEAAARNILLKQTLGRYVVLLDTSVEARDDFLTPLAETLSDGSVGVAGPWGLRTDDLQNFSEIEEGFADAMQAYCFAFPRSLVPKVGLMRESFRFYRNLDLEYSFQFLDQGYRIVALGSLPLERHEHRVWTSMAEDVREKLSRDNFRRFHKRWGHRPDLLVEPSLYHHD